MKRKLLLVLVLAGCGRVKETTPIAPVAAAPACAPPDGHTLAFEGKPMVAICRDVWVEPAATADERARLARDVGEAAARLKEIFGTLQAEEPIAIFCKTPACGLHFTGPTMRSRTFLHDYRVPDTTEVFPRPTMVIVRVDPVAKGVLVHERIHVELGTRVGHGHVPAWFDDGVAVTFSGEPDCREEVPRGIDDLRRVDGYRAFGEYTNIPGKLVPTYCQSAAEVGAWTQRHSKQALLDLVKAVHDGASFYERFGVPAPDVVPAPPAVVMSDGSWGSVTLTGSSDSYVVMTNVTDIADPAKPFSIVMWVKPDKNAGILAHVSTVSDQGWCEPFIGYDRAGHVVSQVIQKPDPRLASFSVATDGSTLPLHAWTHIAMTWAPHGANKLYVNGSKVAEIAAPEYAASGFGPPMQIAWGSNKHRGCWAGAIPDGSFAGAMANMNVHAKELGEAEIKALAKSPPP